MSLTESRARELPADAVATALKNADDLLRSILREVDTNGDGRIDDAGKIMSSVLVLLGTVRQHRDTPA